ncbi:hypothetical protein A134_23160 [Vibrio crassostreae 9CS106]|uniref:Uncharacterized protein n=1 Tax=Vibrio crassostreae 9CS106 TaxID=1191300 RepID=A0A1B1C3B6_9VIBR|nr:hypothetical protein A134_23160 [Vibrio crassostreae 9CS106]
MTKEVIHIDGRVVDACSEEGKAALAEWESDFSEEAKATDLFAEFAEVRSQEVVIPKSATPHPFYEAGTGTSSDPWYIATDEQFAQYAKETDVKYARLAADISMYRYPDRITFTDKNLIGNGRRITNCNVYLQRGSGWSWIHFHDSRWYANGSKTGLQPTNMFFTGLMNPDGGKAFEVNRTTFKNNLVDCVDEAKFITNVYTGGSNDMAGTVLLNGKNCSLKSARDLRNDPDKYLREKHTGLSLSIWKFDPDGLPITMVRKDLPNLDKQVVEGKTFVLGEPASRIVSAFSEPTGILIKQEVSDEVTGEFSLNVAPHTGTLMVTVIDDYGRDFAREYDYEVGDIIHPNTPDGYRYRCTTAGMSADEPPQEPWGGDVVVSGDAEFKGEVIAYPEISAHMKSEYKKWTG